MKKFISRGFLLPGFMLFLTGVFNPVAIFSQNESDIRSVIASGDLKKLAKADEIKDDADNLIEDANKLNMEVFNVQSDPNLDEKAISNKTAQLEDQAVEKQIKAADLYEKSNETKFIIYKSYLDAFWKEHEGEESEYINAKLLEEQANDVYFQATSYRIDAKKMENGFARVEKLTEANNLENEAIQKQLIALAAYYNIVETNRLPEVTEQAVNEPIPEITQEIIPETTPEDIPEDIPGNITDSITENTAVIAYTPPVNTMPDQTLPSQVVVNQSMIDMYNNYISKGQLTDTSLSTGEIAGVTSFEADRLLQIWYDYFYGRSSYTEPALAVADDIAESSDSEPDNSKEAPSSANDDRPSDKPLEIGVVTEENKNTIIPADEEVIYRIQLAANKTQLSQRALSRMYYGNKSVEMINEDGWYKYSVGDFNSYEEANDFRQSGKMTNSFIVAYRKGARFNPVPEQKTDVIQNQVVPVGGTRMPGGLVFRIQVAANRVPLTIAQMEKIYSGNYPVEMIYEDNWYKYQFMGVRLYSDALQIISNINTRGVFIVAYEDGIKLNLADAVRKTSDLENTVKREGRKGHLIETEYHLQLAASRIPMKQDEIDLIYKGGEPVSVILEDGWYKYHIKAGNSPELAEQYKQASNVEKAFIVPYKRAAKISYYDAIQENRNQ